MKIIGYTLQNIQSWDEQSGTIQLSPDRMNVIIAPSETGKSVVMKILKEMCFAGNWGYTWNSLIKRGADCGIAIFHMEDGSAVVYMLWRDKVRYAIMSGDSTIEPRIWEFNDPNHTEIPEEVAQHMGLIIDRKGKTVINVLDKDMVTPFVTAPPELNARIAAVVTVVPEMEKRREHLENWQTQLQQAFKVVDTRLSGVRTRYHNAPEVDILSHQIKLDRVERVLSFVEPLDILVNDIRPTDIPTEPTPVYCPDMDGLIEVYTEIRNLLGEYQELLSFEKPEEVKFDESTLGTILLCHKNVYDIMLDLNSMSTTLPPVEVKMPVGIEELLAFKADVANCGIQIKEFVSMVEPTGIVTEPPDTVLSIDKTLRGISKLCSSYNELLSITPPEEVKINPEVRTVIALQKFINNMPLAEYIAQTELYESAYSKVYEVEKALKDLREELRVCPTCDRPWV